jgi:hypothetical protein
MVRRLSHAHAMVFYAAAQMVGAVGFRGDRLPMPPQASPQLQVRSRSTTQFPAFSVSHETDWHVRDCGPRCTADAARLLR